MALILPRRFTSQPQGAVEIAPQWREVVIGCGLPGMPVGGRFPTSDSSAGGVGGLGRKRQYAGAEQTLFPRAALPAFSGQITVIVAFDADALTNYGALLSCQTSTTAGGFEIRLGQAATDSKLLTHVAASSFRQYAMGSNQITAGDGPHVLAVRMGANITNAPQYALDGVMMTPSAVGGSGSGAMTDPTGAIAVGQREAGTTKLDGGVYFWAILAGDQDAHLQSLSENPWQLFKRQPLIIPTTTAASGAYSLNVDATSYALTFSNPTLKADRKLDVTATSYALTFSDPTLTYAPATAYSLNVDATSYSITFANPTLKADRKLDVTATSYALTFANPTLTYAPGSTYSLNVDATSFAITFANPSLLRTYVADVTATSYALTFSDPTLSYATADGWSVVAEASGTWTVQTPSSNTWTEQ